MSTNLPRDERTPRICAAILLFSAVLISTPAVCAQESRAGDEAAAATTIEGWIVDAGGSPAEGAVVLAIAASAQKPRGPRLPLQEILEGGDEEQRSEPVSKEGGGSAGSGASVSRVAETLSGPDGRFRLELPGPGPFNLRAELRGRGVTRLERIEPGEIGAVVLDPGVTLRGRVMDRRTGEPVAGAEISAVPRFTGGLASGDKDPRFLYEATTAEDGWFRIDHLEPNDYVVRVLAGGYARETLDSFSLSKTDSPPDPTWLYLDPGVDLSGTVTDADGNPVAGANVSVSPDPSARTAPAQNMRWLRLGFTRGRTDEKGAFEFRGVPRIDAYVLDVRHAGYAPARSSGIKPPRDERLALPPVVLTRGTTLTVRLLVDGEPFRGRVSGGLVYSRSAPGFSGWVPLDEERIRLEDGTLTVERLPVGRADLTLDPAGFASVTRKDLELPAGRPAEIGEVALDPGQRITGKVLDADGAPLPGANVQARAFLIGRPPLRRSAESGLDGTFVIGGLVDPDQALQLSVTAEGYAKTERAGVQPGAEAVEIRMQPAGAIRGRVLGGDPPRPLEAFAVKPHGKPLEMTELPGMAAGMFGARPVAFRDAEGKFELGQLAQGTYGIKVDAPGYVTLQRDKIEVAPGETTDLGDLVLEAGATLHGVVTDGVTTRPVGGAAVRLEGPGLFDLSRFTGSSDDRASITGPDGRFTVSGLPPGAHRFRVEHDGYAARTVEVEIAAGVPPAELAVALGAGGAIEGTLRSSSGELIPGGIVTVASGLLPDPNGIVTTDENGHYRVDRLAPGTYRVTAMPRPGDGGNVGDMLGQMKMQTAEVVDGETTIVNLPPDRGGVMVSGVVRRGARPVAARMFWARAAAGGAPEDFAIATSDESGAFEVRLASGGEYQVSVQPRAEEDSLDFSAPRTSLTVQIPEDSPQVTRDVVIPDVVLAGIVLDGETGQPLEGASVQAVEHHEDAPDVSVMPAGSAVTDAEGRYALEGLGEGSYRISVSKVGYGAEVIGPFHLDEDAREEGMNATLFPSSGRVVRVVDEGGRPVEGALVSSLSTAGLRGEGLMAQTGPDGEAKLTGLGDGTHDLGALAGGLAPAVVTGVGAGGEEQDVLEITLRRGAALTIAVLDDEERPIARAAIRVLSDGGPDLTPLLQLAAMLRGQGMVTGPDGTLQIPNLEPGRYEIRATWQGRTAIDKVRVKGQGDNRIELSF